MPELNFDATLLDTQKKVVEAHAERTYYEELYAALTPGSKAAEEAKSNIEKQTALLVENFKKGVGYIIDNTDIKKKIAELMVSDKVTTSLEHTEEDFKDYKTRYVSIDASRGSDRATDIAFMQILEVDNTNTNNIIFPSVSMNQSQNGITNKFKQFILTGIQESSQERMQIAEGSKEYALYFFGSKPEVVTISGILKNTQDNPWSMNMLFAWENYMRGTVLAEKGWIFRLYADGILYEGYPFNFSRNKAAGQDFTVPFSFSFVIKRKKIADLSNSYDAMSLLELMEPYNLSRV